MTPIEARRKLGLWQTEMAALMGDTSPMTVSKWETGTRQPSRQAAELMRLLVWLREYHPDVYEDWTRSYL